MKRARKVGEAMRQVDDETRWLVAQDRLSQLQRDQAASSVDVIGADTDLWEPSDESDAEGKISSKRKAGPRGRQSAGVKQEPVVSRGQKRGKRTIEMILMDEPASHPTQDTFLSVEVPAMSRQVGFRPPLKLCSVCSYASSYKCVRCGSNFCSLKCNSIHRDTKCLKFAD